MAKPVIDNANASGTAQTTTPDEVVLCINCGSSSLKFASFRFHQGVARLLAKGGIHGIGRGEGRAWLHRAGEPERPGCELERREHHADPKAALATAFSLLAEARVATATVVGHRVVHGGDRNVDPVSIDTQLLADLERLRALAPLHLPFSLAGIEAVRERLPSIPQVACFDTAFHASLPELTRRLPLPERLHLAGVRRYGFHGLSYESVMTELGATPPARVIIAHLGAGASLVAVKNGKAIDTSMSLTPSGGIPMGTRSGDLDPGVVLHLLRAEKLSVDALEHLLEHESGLAAVGGSADMQELLERAPSDERASLAVSMFAYAVRKTIGSFTAALGGIDLLVFTGGIGEHAPEVRRLACDGLSAFGIALDADRNRRGADIISSDSSACVVRVIPTQEELTIARHAVNAARGLAA